MTDQLDIVARLRSGSLSQAVKFEAADEIERLRAELYCWRRADNMHQANEYLKKARVFADVELDAALNKAGG